jgi:hypothetical protein
MGRVDAVGTPHCRASRTEPYVRLSRKRLTPRVTAMRFELLRVNRNWAGQAAGSSQVRNAPFATVGPKKAACREGPGGDIANKVLDHLVGAQEE